MFMCRVPEWWCKQPAGRRQPFPNGDRPDEPWARGDYALLRGQDKP